MERHHSHVSLSVTARTPLGAIKHLKGRISLLENLKGRTGLATILCTAVLHVVEYEVQTAENHHEQRDARDSGVDVQRGPRGSLFGKSTHVRFNFRLQGRRLDAPPAPTHERDLHGSADPWIDSSPPE